MQHQHQGPLQPSVVSLGWRCGSWALGCPITLRPRACLSSTTASLSFSHPGLGSVVPVGPSVHTSQSSLHSGRKPRSAGPAPTQHIHSYMKKHGSLFYFSPQIDHLQVAGRDSTSRSIFGRISFSLYPFPELSDRKSPAQQNLLTPKVCFMCTETPGATRCSMH